MLRQKETKIKCVAGVIYAQALPHYAGLKNQ